MGTAEGLLVLATRCAAIWSFCEVRWKKLASLAQGLRVSVVELVQVSSAMRGAVGPGLLDPLGKVVLMPTWLFMTLSN